LIHLRREPTGRLGHVVHSPWEKGTIKVAFVTSTASKILPQFLPLEYLLLGSQLFLLLRNSDPNLVPGS